MQDKVRSSLGGADIDVKDQTVSQNESVLCGINEDDFRCVPECVVISWSIVDSGTTLCKACASMIFEDRS